MSAAKDRAQFNFLRWLSVHDPQLYQKVIAKHFSGSPLYAGDALGSLGNLGWIAALANALIQVGGAVVQKKQQDKAFDLQKKTLAVQDAQLAADRVSQLKLALLDINQKRAANGLGPVDLNGNAIASQSLPMPAALAPYAQGVGVDSASVTPWLIGGAVALAGVFLVMRAR